MALHRNMLLVVNPVSGKGTARARAEAFARCAEAEGCVPSISETRAAGDAQTLAGTCPDDTDVIVSIGGDGTLNEILNGLHQSHRDVPIALFPQGTANVISRELCLPRSLEGLAMVAARGRAKPLDVGLVNGRLFSLAVGVGFDASVVRRVHERRTGSISYAHYIRPMLSTCWHYGASHPLRVQVDGEVICERAYYVVVGNTRRYGGPFAVTPNASMDDGLLDVWALGSCRRRDLLAVMAGAMCGGRHLRHRASVMRQGRIVEVALADEAVGLPGASLSHTMDAATCPQTGMSSAVNSAVKTNAWADVQVDGDVGPALPLRCEILPRAVRIMVPAEG